VGGIDGRKEKFLFISLNTYLHYYPLPYLNDTKKNRTQIRMEEIEIRKPLLLSTRLLLTYTRPVSFLLLPGRMKARMEFMEKEMDWTK